MPLLVSPRKAHLSRKIARDAKGRVLSSGSWSGDVWTLQWGFAPSPFWALGGRQRRIAGCDGTSIYRRIVSLSP